MLQLFKAFFFQPVTNVEMHVSSHFEEQIKNCSLNCHQFIMNSKLICLLILIEILKVFQQLWKFPICKFGILHDASGNVHFGEIKHCIRIFQVFLARWKFFRGKSFFGGARLTKFLKLDRFSWNCGLTYIAIILSIPFSYFFCQTRSQSSFSMDETTFKNHVMTCSMITKVFLVSFCFFFVFGVWAFSQSFDLKKQSCPNNYDLTYIKQSFSLLPEINFFLCKSVLKDRSLWIRARFSISASLPSLLRRWYGKELFL